VPHGTSAQSPPPAADRPPASYSGGIRHLPGCPMFATLAAALVVVWFAAGVWLMAHSLWPTKPVPVPRQDRPRRFHA